MAECVAQLFEADFHLPPTQTHCVSRIFLTENNLICELDGLLRGNSDCHVTWQTFICIYAITTEVYQQQVSQKVKDLTILTN